MSFKIGQKVVCIADFTRGMYNNIVPIKGEIYTVREIVTRNHKTGLLLAEVVNSHHRYNDGVCEKAFSVNCFRPIDYSFGEKIAESITKECESEKETVKEVIELHLHQ
jgi:hypothetical protein